MRIVRWVAPFLMTLYFALPSHSQAAAPGGAGEPHDSTSEAPPLELTGLDGAVHRLSEWRGKVVVLNFWASWCAPCQAEIPDLVAYQRRYAGRGLQVIGIGVDDVNPLRNVQRSLDMNYPTLVAAPEGYRGLLQRWGNSSGVIPYTVIIDRLGRIAYSRRGPMEREEIDARIRPLLD